MSDTGLHDALMAWASEEEALGSEDNRKNATLLRHAAVAADVAGRHRACVSTKVYARERSKLRSLRAENERLRAEVERLEKERDGLSDEISAAYQRHDRMAQEKQRALDRLAGCENAAAYLQQLVDGLRAANARLEEVRESVLNLRLSWHPEIGQHVISGGWEKVSEALAACEPADPESGGGR